MRRKNLSSLFVVELRIISLFGLLTLARCISTFPFLIATIGTYYFHRDDYNKITVILYRSIRTEKVLWQHFEKYGICISMQATCTYYEA